MIETENVDVTPVIEAAALLPDVSCIPNIHFQRLFRTVPENIKRLVRHSVELMSSESDGSLTRGCIAILERLIPVVLMSVSNASELDWLFGGDSSLFADLYIALHGVLFTPGVVAPGTEVIWQWSAFSDSVARGQAVSLIFCAFAGEYFFPSDPDTPKLMRSAAAFDPNNALRLLKSVAAGVQAHDEPFLLSALPCVASLVIHDEACRKAMSESTLMEEIAELLYSDVARLSSVVPYTFWIEPYAIDMQLFAYSALLVGGEGCYDAERLVMAMIRSMQLLNETGKITVSHRVIMILLSALTGVKEKCASLETPVSVTFGTRYAFHTSSIALALLECVTMTFMTKGSEGLHPLLLCVIHNIAPHVVDTDVSAALWLARGLAHAIAIGSDTVVDGLLVAISRYVEHAPSKREKVRAVVASTVANYGESPRKEAIEEAINKTESGHAYPLIIDDVQTHLLWVKAVIIQLFGKRNRIKLGSLKTRELADVSK